MFPRVMSELAAARLPGQTLSHCCGCTGFLSSAVSPGGPKIRPSLELDRGTRCFSSRKHPRSPPALAGEGSRTNPNVVETVDIFRAAPYLTTYLTRTAQFCERNRRRSAFWGRGAVGSAFE